MDKISNTANRNKITWILLKEYIRPKNTKPGKEEIAANHVQDKTGKYIKNSTSYS